MLEIHPSQNSNPDFVINQIHSMQKEGKLDTFYPGAEQQFLTPGWEDRLRQNPDAFLKELYAMNRLYNSRLMQNSQTEH